MKQCDRIADIQEYCRRFANVETGEWKTPLEKKETPLGEKATKLATKWILLAKKLFVTWGQPLPFLVCPAVCWDDASDRIQHALYSYRASPFIVKSLLVWPSQVIASCPWSKYMPLAKAWGSSTGHQLVIGGDWIRLGLGEEHRIKDCLCYYRPPIDNLEKQYEIRECMVGISSKWFKVKWKSISKYPISAMLIHTWAWTAWLAKLSCRLERWRRAEWWE